MGLGSYSLEESAEVPDSVHVVGLPAQLSPQHLGHDLEHLRRRGACHPRRCIDEGTKVGGIGQIIRRHHTHGFFRGVVSGTVGTGLGKAKEVQASIQKGNAQAKKNLVKFPVLNETIPHEIVAKFGSGKFWMKPAAPGTGVIAGGGVRAVLEAAGVKNVLTKSLGSRNAFNVVGATVECLRQLRTAEDIAKLRGK